MLGRQSPTWKCTGKGRWLRLQVAAREVKKSGIKKYFSRWGQSREQVVQSPASHIFRTQLHKDHKAGSALSGPDNLQRSPCNYMIFQFHGSLDSVTQLCTEEHQILASSTQKEWNGVRRIPGFIHWHSFQKLSSESHTLSGLARALPRFELQPLPCLSHSDSINTQSYRHTSSFESSGFFSTSSLTDTVPLAWESCKTFLSPAMFLLLLASKANYASRGWQCMIGPALFLVLVISGLWTRFLWRHLSVLGICARFLNFST